MSQPTAETHDDNDDDPGRCRVEPPESWMLQLNEENTSIDDAQNGVLQGKFGLFYAYGPSMKQYNHVPLWMYDKAQDALDLIWPRPDILGKHKSTLASWMTRKAMLPQYDKVTKIITNAMRPPDFFKLTKVGEKYYAHAEAEGCYIDRVFVCETSYSGTPTSYVVLGYTEPGRQGQTCEFHSAN